ncbi:MAG: arginine--tRNA ligase [Candidatus Shapirobacteria bacterium]|jgi:arginyl-tRNA synthetase
MKFEIDKSVFEKFGDIVEVVPVIYDFDGEKFRDESARLLTEAQENFGKAFNQENWSNDKRVVGYREVFKKFGAVEGAEPSHVAMTKRILDGGKLPDINSIVNIYNSFSIKYLTPFGGEDLTQVYGNLRLTLANGGEQWIAIGSTKSKPAFKGELIWRDEMDVTCRSWNWRQGDRTKLTSESKNGYFVMDGFESNKDEMLRIAKEFVEFVTSNLGGKSEILVLTNQTPSVEINFDSKNVEKVVTTKKIVKRTPIKYHFIAKQIQDFLIEKNNDFQMPIDHPAIEKFGDFAVRGDHDLGGLSVIDRVDKIAGFTNIWIKKEILVEEAKNIIEGGFKNELEKEGNGKVVVIDYSAPNIAKPFGIGHLRSTNIGQALYNLYKYLGWKAIGDNHLGDWGTQFGKMITALLKWNDKPVSELSIDDLEKLYVRFHQEAETDKTLEIEAREWFAKLEKGEPQAREIWKQCVEISLKEFNRVYDLLGVKIDYAYGEAFYENMLSEIIDLFKEKQLTHESQGALLIKLKKNPEAMLLKSDGATNYLTRDLATIKFRMETWNPDLIIYEVGSEQRLHFSQLFEAAEMVGWKPIDGYKHIGHGLIRWKDGKFSTRKGDTIHLAEVIDTAVEQAKKIAPENTEKEIMAVAIGAIKFNDLAQDPTKDIVFDWDKVMSMQGNSGPYLQYTYARCQSVITKADLKKIPTDLVGLLYTEEELALLRYFYIFKEKVVEAATRYSPAVLAEYLLTLARKYNEFYGKCRIIGEPEEGRRIFLTQVTAKIIREGLGILGIESLEKM